MKTILVTNRKGGVGKTTTTTNLASIFGARGYKVVVIDLDTQSHLQYGFGFSKPFEKGIHQALANKTSLRDILIETPFENVCLIPADINYNISSIPDNNGRLKKLVTKANLKDEFDICFIDTPPTSDILLHNGLMLSDFTIVPIKAEFLGVIATNQFLKLFYQTASQINQEIEFLGILPTMFNRSIKEHRALISHLEKKVGKNRMFSPVRNDIKLSKAFLEGKPINYFDKRCRGNKDYEKVVEDMIQKIEKEEGRR